MHVRNICAIDSNLADLCSLWNLIIIHKHIYGKKKTNLKRMAKANESQSFVMSFVACDYKSSENVLNQWKRARLLSDFVFNTHNFIYIARKYRFGYTNECHNEIEQWPIVTRKKERKNHQIMEKNMYGIQIAQEHHNSGTTDEKITNNKEHWSYFVFNSQYYISSAY